MPPEKGVKEEEHIPEVFVVVRVGKASLIQEDTTWTWQMYVILTL